MHNSSSHFVETARELFDLLRQRLARFNIIISDEHEYLDLTLDIPEQPGLDFAIHANLQNDDELNLEACGLWMVWFPCDKRSSGEDFLDVVEGLVSGRYRIAQTICGGIVAKARLQVPVNGSWKQRSSGRWTFKWPFFGTRETRFVVNGEGRDA